MELQWPLILFTTFIAWSAGLFATQGICALRGEGAKSQIKALIVSVVLLAVGGIAVFFHLQHWERIFNGFGHLSSGITQELIAVVVMFVVMVVMFAYLRRTAADPHVPAWVSVLAILTALILVVACGHSYVMASRPAWNSMFEMLSLVGAACILGPATFALIAQKEAGKTTDMSLVVGSVLNAVFSIAYLASMSMASYTQFDATYFDPTSPTQKMVDVTSLNAFSGDALLPSVVVVVGAVIALAAALLAKKQTEKRTVWAAVALVVALVAAVCLRVVFYVLGVSVFAFY